MHYENIYLSAKLESDLQTVALEYSGLSDDLSRTDSVSSNFNAAMDVSALCHYGSVCISEHSIGGNDGNRLHGLCVSVFRDRTAVILLEVRMIMKNKKSTQNLFGLRTFGKYSLQTDKAELAFFSVQPTNISVLSAENIDVKIYHLMMLLSMIPELEIICLDKVHIKNRLKSEENPNVRKLLKQDAAFLDDIQVEMSTARQFLFCIRFRDK